VIATVSSNGSNVEIRPVAGVQPTCVEVREDGAASYSFNTWPSMEDVQEYGHMIAAPLPVEMATLIGRIIVQSAMVEQRVRAILRQLCSHNGSELDWQSLGKYGAIITRLQKEAGAIAKAAPTGSIRLKDAAEKCRKLHRSRSNLAHGEISLLAGEGALHVIATGKHEQEWFSEPVLRDLALTLCRVSYELKAALDPDDQDVKRIPRETQFLRDLHAKSPLPEPVQAVPPGASRTKKRPAR
jgi:hypothetical protein